VKLFSRRWLAAALAGLVLLLFLVRPGASRLKTRITNSISRAVARPADISSVHLRFLPQPGFDLENLVIYEDPAFGAEPMLRAPEVTAVVRLSSLVRGRFDISRLELTEPSLNLVQREDGRWNWESLLEHTAQTPLAPTAKAKSEPRPGFPYIEASSGRINFKIGAEKKPYALLNADFSLWQDSENAWGVRLKAEPLRTDISLSDTGLLRLNGTWQRAGSLRETPLLFSLEWDHAQLGQLTKLVSGDDKGWRGDVRFDATLGGTPQAMQLTADAAIQNFRRYDISTGEGFGLAAHCQSKYNSAEGMLREIVCSGPVGGGVVTLRGDAGRPGIHLFDLSLNLEEVPVSSVAQLARRAKKGLPVDLTALGTIHGNFSMKRSAASSKPIFEGRGEVTGLRLESASARAVLAPVSVPFFLSSSGQPGSGISSSQRLTHPFNAQPSAPTGELRVLYGPFPVGLGQPSPAQAQGWVGRSGYHLALHGEGEISQTLRMAGLIGLSATRANAEGAARMDLQIDGSWAGNATGTPSGFISPKVIGTAQLREVRATLRGANAPFVVSSAELKLLPDEVRAEKLLARAAGAHWSGSIALPRGCGTPGACLVRFHLNTDEMALSGLAAWLRSHPSQRRWYDLLAPDAPPGLSFLQNLRASGTIEAGRIQIHSLVANRVSAALELDRGKVKISDLRADLLGGTHRGVWLADFTGASPLYTGSGTLSGISLEKLAEMMQDPWISGMADGDYQLKAAGSDSKAFWQSAAGEIHFDLRDGVLSHISLLGDQSLQIAHGQGSAQLNAGKIEIVNGKIASPSGIYELSGSASSIQVIDFKLTSSTPGSAGPLVYSITGTLAEPHVTLTPSPETQARLKP
jgi:hypothetical protein